MGEEIVTSALRSFTAVRKLARGNLFTIFGGITNLQLLVSKVFVRRMRRVFFICALGGRFRLHVPMFIHSLIAFIRAFSGHSTPNLGKASSKSRLSYFTVRTLF